MERLAVPHTVLASTVILVVLLAGCLSGIGGTQPQTTTTPPQPIEAGSDTPCVSALAYYYGGVNGSASFTSPDEVWIGYLIDGGAAAVFVASENETILGTSFTSAEYTTVADGHPITFDDQLNGTHTVQVSAYEDTNRNQEFDRGIDRPCYNNGEHVQTRKEAFNLSSASR